MNYTSPQAVTRGAKAEEEWKAGCAEYAKKYPKEFAEFEGLVSGKLPQGWEVALPTFKPEDKEMATRQHSNTMLNVLAPVLPGLIGGSADLAPSNLTLMKISGDFQKNSPAERNLRFGVREHGELKWSGCRVDRACMCWSGLSVHLCLQSVWSSDVFIVEHDPVHNTCVRPIVQAHAASVSP